MIKQKYITALENKFNFTKRIDEIETKIRNTNWWGACAAAGSQLDSIKHKISICFKYDGLLNEDYCFELLNRIEDLHLLAEERARVLIKEER